MNGAPRGARHGAPRGAMALRASLLKHKHAMEAEAPFSCLLLCFHLFSTRFRLGFCLVSTHVSWFLPGFYPLSA
jgi:hypothetical protein